jgi:photosystem II stability/assembly factor-like uncharacterized protein
MQIASASEFNFGTGKAAKSELANITTINAMYKYDDMIYAVGEHGVILYSDTWGMNWTQSKVVPFMNTLTDINCVSDAKCWAVGHDATILYSSDGGRKWVKQYHDQDFDAPLLSIFMQDYLHGFAVGAFSYALKTEDGGENWIRFDLSRDEYEPHLNFIYGKRRQVNGNEDKNIYAVAEIGQYYLSSDLGKTWNTVDTGYFGSLWSGIRANNRESLLLGMSGKMVKVSQRKVDNIDSLMSAESFETNKFPLYLNDSWQEFEIETLFIGTKNSLTNIKYVSPSLYVLSGNGGVVSIVNLDPLSRTIETCVRADRLSNTSVMPIDDDEYLLSGEKGFRIHSMAECKENFEDKSKNSKDVWMISNF